MSLSAAFGSVAIVGPAGIVRVWRAIDAYDGLLWAGFSGADDGYVENTRSFK